MEYRDFGRAKVKVSVVGMGTWYDAPSIVESHVFGHLRGEQEKIAALKKGLELGITLIDTAEIYNTEPLVAEAIKGHKRDELFISTKVWPLHLKYDDVLKAAQRSLENPQSSYIDMYMIHWPSPRVPIKETMRAMEKLVDDGKIRYIGVSNFPLRLVKEAEEALFKNELVSNEVEYNLVTRDIESELLPYCEKNGIMIMAYRPIAHGALADPSGRLKAIIDDISKKHGGKTPAQIALNWLLNKGKVVFPIPRAREGHRRHRCCGLELGLV